MRPFILLELLIAFTLLTASILPFIRHPMKHLSRELDALFRMELSRRAEQAFVDTKAEFYRGNFSKQWFDRTYDKDDPGYLYLKKTVELKFSEEIKRSFEQLIYIKSVSRKHPKESAEDYHLLNMTVLYRLIPSSKIVVQAESTLFCNENQLAK